ncbi:MAG: hypothetical protein C5B50_02655 [Verrucomicrobia bacterium]|nr:MAG: hypothetical protein C5B50_02655 [Verrucomicrobiota bacterium]
MVQERGGAVNPARLPFPLQDLANITLDSCTQIRVKINSSPLLWPLGEAQIQIVNNDDFNAFAHHRQGCEGIGIYLGTFERLTKLSIALWSEEGLLSNARVGWRANEVLQDYVGACELEHWRTLHKSILSEEHLAQRRMNTALTSLCYVFMHEVGHLVRAHIPFLSKRASCEIATLYERGNTSLPCSNTELQFFEIDADVHAVEAVTDFALTTWAKGRIFPVNFAYPKGDLFSYLVDFYRGVCMAMFCLDCGSTSRRLASRSNHPVAAVRLGIACLASMRLLDHPFQIPQKTAFAACVAASMEVGDLFTRKGFSALTLENDLILMLEKSAEMMKRSEFYLDGKQSAIDERLQSMGRDPRHFDQYRDFYKRK